MVQLTSPSDTEIIINGVDVTDYALPGTKWSREWSKSIATSTILLKRNVKDVLTINDSDGIGYYVTIRRGTDLNVDGKYVFRGHITKVNLNGAEIMVTCKDPLNKTIKKRVTTGFDINVDSESGVISEIVKTLLSRNTSLNFTNDSIVDTGTFFVLETFECKQSELYERLQDLADSVNYQLYYNPVDDLVYFEPKAFTTSSQLLRVGEEIVNIPNWEINDDFLVNILTIEGATQEVQDTKYGDGDGTEGQFVFLDFVPNSVKVYVGSGTFDPDNNNKPSNSETNLKKGGKRGSTSGSFDYDYDDNPKVKRVFFYDSSRGDEPSFTPLSGTKNIEIQYSYDIPTPVKGRVQGSIDKHGLYEDTFTKTNIKSVIDAEKYLQSYLNYFGFPFINDTVNVDGIDYLQPGVLHEVEDDVNNVNRELMIVKVNSFYPYNSDEVELGDEKFKLETFEVDVWDRLKRLEEKSSRSSDFLVQIFDSISEVSEKSRMFELYKSNVAGETGVYGHLEFGVYGTAKYGNTTASTFILGSEMFGVLGTGGLGDQSSDDILVKLMPGNNVYEEFLYDDEFLDLTSIIGTVELDTSEKTLYISPSSSIETYPLSIGIPYNTFRVNFPNIVNIDNILVEITYNNGSDWLTVESFDSTINFPEEASIVKLRLSNTS